MQNTKADKHKKGFDEQIALMHSNRKKEDVQISQKGMTIKKQNKFSSMKNANKRRETMIIGLLLHEAPRKWPYTKWSSRCSRCPLKAPPNQDGHLM